MMLAIGSGLGYILVGRSAQTLDGIVRDIQLTTAGIIALEAALLWLIFRGSYARSVEQARSQVRATERALNESELAYDQTLQALANALYVRDLESEGQAARVARYMEQIARELGPAPTDLATLRRGALLHDVGKIGIPDEILRKTGDLTDEEWAVVKRHPVYGARILAGIPFLRAAMEIVRHHHERWDGSGYPDGLAGEDIPLGARIFAVEDSFDAMTSDRPYRSAKSVAEARREIVRNGGRQFDPAMVVAFLRIPEERIAAIQEESPRTRPFATPVGES